MEELLLLLLEVFAEVVVDVFCAGTWDLGATAVREARVVDADGSSGWWWAVPAIGAGCCLGGLTLLVMPMPLISVPTLRVVNLILAPVIAGYTAFGLAKWRVACGSRLHVPTRVIATACFTLGLVCIRFAYGHHPA